MIKSKEDYLYYLEADRIAKGVPKKKSLTYRIKKMIAPHYAWEFQKTLRKLEYYMNVRKGLLGKAYTLLIMRKFSRLSVKLGFTIPPNVFGPGLSIAHHGTLLVNIGCEIGANCRLHTGVSIGTTAGFATQAPTIGDNCYIGPGVKMYGDIVLADGIAIGANSVVNKSFEEPGIAIAGVPARRIAEVDTFDMIIPATYIIAAGLNNRDDILGIPAKELKERFLSDILKKSDQGDTQ